MYDLGWERGRTYTPEGIVKELWVSVSGIGHSDIRGLGSRIFSYRQVNGPPRALPSKRVDHKKCHHMNKTIDFDKIIEIHGELVD